MPCSVIPVQDALQLFAAAANSSTQPSSVWMQQLCTATTPILQKFDTPGICALLQHLAEINYTPPPPWMQALVAKPCSDPSVLTPAQLCSFLWSLSNLQHTLEAAAVQKLLEAVRTQLQDFYAPDLCRLVAALGAIWEEPQGSELVSEIAAECEYQLVEFPSDFEAFDLARLATGLAVLGVAPTERLQGALIKVVYMRTRTIEEKAAVDFALARLDSKGKKSMHYDARWTHEELQWLPRRERDKRRLLKDGWFRTKWSGWAAGQ